MQKFKMIPCIYAGNLPVNVQEELEEVYQHSNLCFHGDGGCVFLVYKEKLDKLILFKAWMIEIEAWPIDFNLNGFPGATYAQVAMTGT